MDALFWHLIPPLAVPARELAVLLAALWIVLGLFVLETLVWVILFRVAYMPKCDRFFEDVPMLRAEHIDPEPDAEECSFTTADGLTLRGSYLATSAAQRLGVILYCHELNGDRWNMLPYLRELRSAGYDLFGFDFRNHGTSDTLPGYQAMPWLTQYECFDVEAAAQYLQQRDDADPRGFAAMGTSRGANAAIYLAAKTPAVRALVTDGAFPVVPILVAKLRHFMRIYTRYAWFYAFFPDWLLGWHMIWTLWVRTQRDTTVRFVRTECFFRQVHQPALMIHGEQDPHIAPEISVGMSKQIQGLVRHWIVPGAKHNRAIHTAPEEYGQILESFLAQHVSCACSARTGV